MAEIEAKNGLVRIDGHEAGAVDYTRVVDGDRVSYDLRFRMGRKVVHRVKGVDANEMVHTVGEENAAKIHRNASEKGTLSGKDLTVHDGLSPQAQENVIEQAVQSEMETAAAIAREKAEAGSPDKKRFLDQIAKREEDTRRGDEVVQGKRDDTATKDVKDRRQDEPAAALAEQLEQRRKAQLEALKKQFIVVDSRYYFKDRNQALAFQDKGSRLVTADKGPAVTEALVQMAIAKGWTTLKVNGTHDFKRDMWIAGTVHGLKVPGYTPTEADKASVLRMIEARSTNTVEKGKEPEKAPPGRQKERAQEDRRKPDEPSKEEIDAKRKRAQRAEDYNPLRPGETQVVEKVTVVGRVIQSIAADRIRNPETRQRVEQEVQRRLAQLAAGGRVPTIKVYDQQAPSQNRGAEKAKAPDHRKAERTR